MIVLRIKAIAADRGINLTTLADQVGINFSHFSRITHNKRKTISYDLLEKLCFALNCTPGELIEYRPDVKAGK